jgi:hypothetical protein
MRNTVTKVLKIRNPCNDIEYNGKCSEGDDGFWSKVSQQGKSGILKKKGNTFLISFYEFLLNFNNVDISCEKKDYNYIFNTIHV